MKKWILLFSTILSLLCVHAEAQVTFCGDVYYSFWSLGNCPSFGFGDLEDARVVVDQCNTEGIPINICTANSEDGNVCGNDNWTCTDEFNSLTPEITIICKKFDSWQNGVTLADRSVLVLHLNGQLQIANPYVLSAADMNNDGALGQADVTEMNNIMNNPSYSPPNLTPGTVFQPWRFMTGVEFYDLAFMLDFCTDPFGTAVDYPHYWDGTSGCEPVLYSIGGGIGNWGQFDFFGIKVGDLDFDAETLAPKGGTDRSAAIASSSLQMVANATPEYNELQLFLPDIERLMAYEFHLSYLSNLLEIDAIENHLPGIFEVKEDEENGLLSFSYTHDKAEPLAMDASPVISIRYQSALPAQELFDLHHSPEHAQQVLYWKADAQSYNSFGDYDLFMQSEPFLLSQLRASNWASNKQQAVTAFPNPVEHTLNLAIPATQTQHAQILLYDVKGALLKSLEVELDTGINQYPVDLSGVQSDLLIWRVESAEHSVSGKVFRKH